MDPEWYPILKFVHIAAAVLWSGSAIGAFWFVLVSRRDTAANPDDPELVRRDLWVRAMFSQVVIVEHVAFVVLLPTGWWLMSTVGYLALPWMKLKLALVLAIMVPLELADIWLSHRLVPRALARTAPTREAFSRCTIASSTAPRSSSAP